MTALAEGAVALHDDQGQHVLIGRDGITVTGRTLTFASDGDIAFTADGAITLAGDSFKVTAGSAELASDDVKLGNGAMLAAARKTDTVASNAINLGSAKVKIA